jgi:hypothetical protein
MQPLPFGTEKGLHRRIIGDLMPLRAKREAEEECRGVNPEIHG